MRIISLLNQKGGVGKTTSTLNIGAGLATLKKKVLLVDVDPQANLSSSLGIEAYGSGKTIYEVMRGVVSAKEAVINKGAYDVIPSSIELTGADIELSSIAGRELLLKESLLELSKSYDYVLLDCPPSLGILTLNSLVFSTEIFIPLQTEYLAMQGLSQLINTYKIVKKRLNPDLKISGIICTFYDGRKNLNKEVMEKTEEYFKDKLFRTFIRDNVALAEAPSFNKDIFTYNKKSYGAADYLALCNEIIAQEKEAT